MQLKSKYITYFHQVKKKNTEHHNKNLYKEGTMIIKPLHDMSSGVTYP